MTLHIVWPDLVDQIQSTATIRASTNGTLVFNTLASFVCAVFIGKEVPRHVHVGTSVAVHNESEPGVAL